MHKSIFKEGKKYTFSDYFEFGNPTEEIIGDMIIAQFLTMSRSSE